MGALSYRQLLEFYGSAGVDEALGEAPIDRFSAAEPAPVGSPAGEAAKAVKLLAGAPAPPVPTDEAQALDEARALAKGATTLAELRAALESFEGCALKKSARQMVFADGNPQASVMLIGEAPGREEDAQGLPFVGKSGQLLDRMLAAIGLDRTSVYIGNVIYWRPPGNRTPSAQERALCEPFIRRQIELVGPKVMMTLGGSALSTLFEGREGIMRTRGQVLTYGDAALRIPTVPTLHPAALLRNAAHKPLVWRDLLVLQALIKDIQREAETG